MALRNIVVEGDEILRKKCREVGEITDRIKLTLEDMLEELVGEIWDENDDIINDWQELSKNRFECSGDMNLSELFDNLDLDDEELETDCTTVGGWAAEVIGAMPVEFDAFDYKNFTILVKHVDENHRIERMLILKHNFGDEED